MEIVYSLVNFLLLALLIWLFGRKMIKRIFEGRRERINAELDEAEEIEKTLSARESEEPAESQPEAVPEEDESGLDALRAKYESEKARLCILFHNVNVGQSNDQMNRQGR